MDNNNYLANTVINYNSSSIDVNQTIPLVSYIGEGEIDSLYVFFSNRACVVIEVDGVITTFEAPADGNVNLYFNKQQFQNIDANSSSLSVTYISTDGSLKGIALALAPQKLIHGTKNSISGSRVLFGNFKFKKYCNIMLYNGGISSRSFQYSIMVTYTPSN